MGPHFPAKKADKQQQKSNNKKSNHYSRPRDRLGREGKRIYKGIKQSNKHILKHIHWPLTFDVGRIPPKI